ncbi:MAG TPA: YkgJ family cysteine cluster protein [Bryobacteraceae bacterium]
MSETGSVTFNLELSAGQRTIEASVAIPEAPMRVTGLLPVLFGFSNAISGMAEEEARQAAKPASCRAGCGACCRQLVPVSEPEAEHLAALVAELPEERREQIRERFRAAIAALGEELAGRLRDIRNFPRMEDRRAVGLAYFAKGVACPFLENESCSIYEQRPLSCREYLVSSPPENCKDPGPGRIAPVPLPLKLSEVLYGFDEAGTGRGVRWIPLVLALDWAAAHADDMRRYAPGAKLFEGFLAHLASVTGDR